MLVRELSKMRMKNPFLLSVFITVIVWSVVIVEKNLTPEINNVSITLDVRENASSHRRVALLSDLHIGESQDELARLTLLWSQVLAERPDIILLAGDYTKDKRHVHNIDVHRRAIAEILGESKNIPVVAVLGNHETWSSPSSWSLAFRQAGIHVLENKIYKSRVANMCVRGLGDYFTKQFRYVDFPASCADKLNITLTHDPAGAFEPGVVGLIFAGHTHCGQVRLPFFGAPYVPTSAPKGAHCGLYSDAHRQLFVSAGVGTSVVPLRFLAQAQWDLITFN